MRSRHSLHESPPLARGGLGCQQSSTPATASHSENRSHGWKIVALARSGTAAAARRRWARIVRSRTSSFSDCSRWRCATCMRTDADRQSERWLGAEDGRAGVAKALTDSPLSSEWAALVVAIVGGPPTSSTVTGHSTRRERTLHRRGRGQPLREHTHTFTARTQPQ